MKGNEKRLKLRPALKAQTAGREMLFGTFLKTASHQTVEVLGSAGLDFLIVDAEHAPFSRSDIDRILLAARSVSLPCLVRVPSVTDSLIGASLDLGASGVVIPHVAARRTADAAVAAARFRGARGFSPSTRAAGYGTTNPKIYLEQSDRSTSVWCQIEDVAALGALNDIVLNQDVDCLLIGRADLAVSMGVDEISHADVRAAVAEIAAAGRQSGTAVAIYVSDLSELEELRAMGISVYVWGSDQSWLVWAARENALEFASHRSKPRGERQ